MREGGREGGEQTTRQTYIHVIDIFVRCTFTYFGTLLTFFRHDAFRVNRLTIPRDCRLWNARHVAHEHDCVAFLNDDVIARQLVNNRCRNCGQREAKRCSVNSMRYQHKKSLKQYLRCVFDFGSKRKCLS